MKGMKPHALPSIRQRLSRVLGGIALVWGLAMTVGVGALTHAVLDEVLDGALRESAEILYGLVAAADHDDSADHKATGMLMAPPHQENLVWQLVNPQGHVQLRSHKAPMAPLTDRQTEGYTGDADGWHVFTLPMRDGRSVLHVAQRESSRRAMLVVAMGATIGLTVLVGVSAAIWLRRGLRRELQPLLDLSAAVASLEPLAPRTAVASLHATRTELEPLVGAIGELTDRLARQVSHERALAAHAAHALRTPLAGMDAQLAVALKEAPPSLQPRLTQTREAAARLRRVVTALIALFRTGGEVAWQATSVSALLQRLPVQGVSVEPTGADTVPCDPDLMSAALSNLLDNAARHGARRIQVEAAIADGQVVLTLRDDGDGIAVDRRQRLQDALDAQGPQEGLGLGLTLADMVARAHGGRLHVGSPSADAPSFNGAVVSLRWPVPPQP